MKTLPAIPAARTSGGPPARGLLLACCLTATLLAAAGCADEDVDPFAPGTSTTTTSPTTTTATTTGEGGSGGEGGGGPAPVVIRTVEQRNPFGNVAASDNLLWDGDFEWSSPFSDQYGWLFGPPYGYAFPAATVGADCRSGIKCVTLPKNRGIIGIGVGSGTGSLVVSTFAKPKTGVCADVDVSLIGLFTGAGDETIPPTADAPDSTGWCQYRATIASYPKKAYLLVDNNSGDDLLVDDAVLRAVPPDEPPPSPAPPPAAPPTAERQARRDEAREAALRLRGPHLPPPNAARRAFEEHLAR